MTLANFRNQPDLLDAVHALAMDGTALPADLLPTLTARGVTTADGKLTGYGVEVAAEWGRSLKFQAWQKAAREQFEASRERKAAAFAAFVDTLAS